MKYSSDFESDTIARAALAFLGHLKMLFFTQNFHLSVANSENYILFRSVARLLYVLAEDFVVS
jgi:hypothetical protein